MHNFERERSEYVFEIYPPQIEALLAIAAKEDKPLEEIIMSALDEYIKCEKESCRTKT